MSVVVMLMIGGWIATRLIVGSAHFTSSANCSRFADASPCGFRKPRIQKSASPKKTCNPSAATRSDGSSTCPGRTIPRGTLCCLLYHPHVQGVGDQWGRARA
jgi:hypothetical protein